MLYDNLGVNDQGHLTVGGLDTVALAEEFGAPLYVLDEDQVRANCRAYRQAMEEWMPAGSLPAAVRLVSLAAPPGLLSPARAGGSPAEKLYFHGNNKTDEDIAYALDCGVGCFIVDNHQELERLEQAAGARGHRQRVLLRVTPGIDTPTLQAINTGRIDCQSGAPIETGQAAQFVVDALSRPHLQVEGFHSHIGSQIFEAAPFCDAVDILLDFAQAMRQAHGFVARTLNLGGGFGVRYQESDPAVDIPGNIRALADHLRRGCETKGYPMPRVLLEPGRSIVANAGLTLYRVGGVKTIAGYRSYVTVNGGMTDNPRYALYQAPYTVLPASRMGETRDFLCTVAGRCCESGDLIQENVSLPQPARDDLLAVLTTGAYNFTMASNYNRLCRPALVMVRVPSEPSKVMRPSPDTAVTKAGTSTTPFSTSDAGGSPSGVCQNTRSFIPFHSSAAVTLSR